MKTSFEIIEAIYKRVLKNYNKQWEKANKIGDHRTEYELCYKEDELRDMKDELLSNPNASVTMINFNAKEGKYEYIRKNLEERELDKKQIDITKISLLELLKLKINCGNEWKKCAKSMGEDKLYEYNKIIGLMDPVVYSLLDEEQKAEYMHSLYNSKYTEELDFNTIVLDYDMREAKKNEMMSFLKKKILNRTAKKHAKLEVANYQKDVSSKEAIMEKELDSTSTDSTPNKSKYYIEQNIVDINFNAKEGKYKCRVTKSNGEEQTKVVSAKKMSFFKLREFRKKLKQDYSIDKKIAKLVDPNVYNLLDKAQQMKYIKGLYNTKYFNDMSLFRGNIHYDMSGLKQNKSMRFFEKMRLNRVADKQYEMDFAMYEEPEVRNRKISKKIGALIGAGLIAVTAIGVDKVNQHQQSENSIQKKHVQEINLNKNTKKQTDRVKVDKNIKSQETNINEENENEQVIGIGTKINLKDGKKYYSSIDRQGPSGRIQNEKGNNSFEIEYIATENNDGTIDIYNKKSDINNMSEVEKGHKDSKIYIALKGLGWMLYDDEIKSSFEEQNKTIELSDGSNLKIGQDGKIKLTFAESLKNGVELKKQEEIIKQNRSKNLQNKKQNIKNQQAR